MKTKFNQLDQNKMWINLLLKYSKYPTNPVYFKSLKKKFKMNFLVKYHECDASKWCNKLYETMLEYMIVLNTLKLM